jgi:hypothetical protein
VNGRLAGGTPKYRDVKCRIVEIVGEITVPDGRKMAVQNKVFIDNIDLSNVDDSTLQITFGGKTRKVIRASRRQLHIKLWL